MKNMYCEGALRFVPIRLSDADPKSVLNDVNSIPIPTRVQLLRTGKFFLPRTDQPLQVTSEMLRKMAENFESEVRGIDLAIDYKHDSDDIAAAWIRRVELDENTENDEATLWAEVDWTPKGKQIVGEKEFRYLSADFHPNYQDNETQSFHGPTLLGAGLTNRPVVKRMEPVVQLSEYRLALEPSDDLSREELKSSQKERSDKFGVEIVESAALTFPNDFPQDLNLYGDPVNLKFPVDSVDRARNARVRFKQFGISGYKNEKSRAIVHDRMVKRELDLGIVPSFDDNDSLDQLLSPDLKAKLKKGNTEMGEKELKDKIASLETQLSEAKAKNVKLGEMQKKLEEMEMSPEEMMAKIKSLTAELEAMKGENSKLKEGAQLSEKNKEFDKLLSEGKAVEAQREAYIAGDTVKFAELSEDVNLRGKGSGGTGGKGGAEKSAADQVIELSEKKMKDNPKLSAFDAHSEVLSENPELEKKYRKEQGED